jgi:hypothetical protein
MERQLTVIPLQIQAAAPENSVLLTVVLDMSLLDISEQLLGELAARLVLEQ